MGSLRSGEAAACTWQKRRHRLPYRVRAMHVVCFLVKTVFVLFLVVCCLTYCFVKSAATAVHVANLVETRHNNLV